jgi:hypothetical protein
MTTQLSQSDKSGFQEVDPSNFRKEENAIKRLWNDADGKQENSKFKLIKSSGKGFYDGSAEAIYIAKKSGKQFLVRVSTSYGRSWKSPDNISITGVK